MRSVSRTPWGCYVDAIQRYADVAGRADRRQFWGFALIVMLLIVGFSVLASGLGATLAVPLSDPDLPPMRIELFGPAVALVHVVPVWSIACRRLHDVGVSAWWLVLGIFPIVGPLILAGFFLWPGEPADNGFGPKPV